MTRARTVVALCKEFHCLPSQLEQEDATLLGMLAIVERGGDRGDE